jgi:hypothetical protein
MRFEQALLPLHAHFIEQDVARVAKQLVVGHRLIVTGTKKAALGPLFSW